MTVQELINQLSEFDPEMIVLTRGFDESLFEPLSVRGVVRVAVFKRTVSGSIVYREEEGNLGVNALHLDWE